MAIAATDVVLRYSVVAAAGDTTVGTPAGALGDQVSTTVVPTTAAGVYDNVSGTENAASTQDFRCEFVLNNHATLTAVDVRVFIASEVAGGTSIALGVDPTAASAKGAATAQALTIASETTAPAGVTFSSPTTDAAALSLGDLAPGQVRAFWIRRTAGNTAGLASDGVTFGINFDTLP
jgi:hypothetical protein